MGGDPVTGGSTMKIVLAALAALCVVASPRPAEAG